MKKVDSASEEKLPLALNLFGSKPVNTGFQTSTTVEYNPTNPHGTWPARFSINSGLSYLDLSQTYLLTTFRLKKKETTKGTDGRDIIKAVNVTKDDKISFINGFGATSIQNLKVLLNGRQIYNATDLYGYNAYFRRRLGLETSRNQDDLQLAGYFEDDDESQVSGSGFEKRRKFFENGADFHAICSLDVDFFKQNKLLLNEMTVDIEITPNNNSFCLLSQDNTEYFFSFIGFKLYVKQHHLLPELDAKIQSELKANRIAKYPYTRNLMTNFFINAGLYDYKAMLFNDFIPKRIFIALVDGIAFNGSTKHSPFEFKPFNLHNIQVSANGRLIPAYPYDLGRKDYARAFKDLVDTTENTGITYQQYLTHSCIFAFDFRSMPRENVAELQHMGTTSLAIRFDKPVPTSGIQVIVYAEFDSLMAFDFARNITTALPV